MRTLKYLILLLTFLPVMPDLCCRSALAQTNYPCGSKVLAFYVLSSEVTTTAYVGVLRYEWMGTTDTGSATSLSYTTDDTGEVWVSPTVSGGDISSPTRYGLIPFTIQLTLGNRTVVFALTDRVGGVSYVTVEVPGTGSSGIEDGDDGGGGVSNSTDLSVVTTVLCCLLFMTSMGCGGVFFHVFITSFERGIY